MEDAITIISVTLFVGIGVYAYRHEKKKRPFLNALEKVKTREADLDGIRIVAERLGKDVLAWIPKTGHSLLFVSACGDIYEDFFPDEEPERNLSPEERANRLMGSYLMRVAEANARRDLRGEAKKALCFCEGAGFGLVTMRRLTEYIPELAEIAQAMAEPPSYGDAEVYADFYRTAGRIAGVREEWIEEGLADRLEQLAAG